MPYTESARLGRPTPPHRVDPARGAATLRRALCVSVLALALACTDTGDGISAPLPPEEAVRTTLDGWRLYMEEHNLASATAFFSADYLHQSAGPESLGLWLEDLLAIPDLTLRLTNVRVTITDETAVVDYILTVSSCPEEEEEEDAGSTKAATDEPAATGECSVLLRCHSRAAAECGWLRHLERGPAGWLFVGDRQAERTALRLRLDADGLGLEGEVYAPRQGLSAVSVTWLASGDHVALEKVSSSLWRLPAAAPVPAVYEAGQPLPWELEVALDDRVVPYTFSSVMETFAADVQPTGEVVPPILIGWSGVSEAPAGAEVVVLADDQTDWRTVWQSARTFRQPLPYAGPELAGGEEHRLEVRSFDLEGNYSVAAASFTPIDASEVTPDPQVVVPATGRREGGERVRIDGENFLSGLRVRFGPSECLNVDVVSDVRVECTTPALEPGVYDVIVTNPSGRVGILEAGFQVP